jgi:hypothetical protein
VDQRIDVDALDRQTGTKRALPVDMVEAAGCDDEQRTEPLTAADRGIAHRLVKAGPRVGRRL